jgi:NAD(P)H-hydrate repair Nnr-like enzyme with NAD(P)H-hydrate epimerase domain
LTTPDLLTCAIQASFPRKSILEAIAVGLRNGLNFGGLVGQLQPLTDQHINFRVIVDAVFGAEGSSNSTG